ncbi:Phosphotransferase enzyme family protein [Streptomyces sp. TLI_105]|nr:Phosphotransferase enzyme family protein [Streptomyces sp. TLI_105]
MDLPSGRARALSEAFVDALADLHRVDPAAAGLADLGKGEGYVRRQVEGWTCRYVQARTWNTPGFQHVTAWPADHQPDDAALCVVHNDWRLDSLALHEETLRVTGVLDWELATLGDPLMGLGSAMAYWVQADDGRMARAMRRQPSHLPGMLTRTEIVERYCDRAALSAPAPSPAGATRPASLPTQPDSRGRCIRPPAGTSTTTLLCWPATPPHPTRSGPCRTCSTMP